MIGVDTTFLVHLELIELPAHKSAHEILRNAVLQPQIQIALVPQVLAEFIHVVTDPRCFQQPLTLDEAVAKARFWWEAAEVEHVLPSKEATGLFLDWMQRHRFGRKRILDTQEHVWMLNRSRRLVPGWSGSQLSPCPQQARQAVGSYPA